MVRAPVTIVATTYFPRGEDGASRAATAKRAIISWQRSLQYDGTIRLHVADDGSAREHSDDFARIAGKYLDSASRQERHGVGASLNAGFRAAFKESPLVLYAVDDWLLTSEFNITPWADLLIDDPTVGMVRFFPHPWISGQAETFAGGWGMRLERHHFAFGHRPAIYHKRMLDAYGWFDEDCNAYDCEARYNERFCERNAHMPGCVEATRLNPWRQCPAPEGGCEILEENRGPSIVLALPSPWVPDPESVELAHVEPSAPQTSSPP